MATDECLIVVALRRRFKLSDKAAKEIRATMVGQGLIEFSDSKWRQPRDPGDKLQEFDEQVEATHNVLKALGELSDTQRAQMFRN